MAKSLDANIIAEIDASQCKPVFLLEMELSDSVTLKFVRAKADLIFPHGGIIVYTSKAFTIDDIVQEIEGNVGRITIKLDNVSKDMGAYAEAYDFEGKWITIKKIFLDADNHSPADATEYIELFRGKMEVAKDIEYIWLTVEAYSGEPLKTQALTEIYSRTCRHQFGNTQCNQDGNSDLTSLTHSGTATGGTTTTLVDTGFAFSDDEYNHGKIIITKGGITYIRNVMDSVASTFTLSLDLAVPVTIDATTTYQVWKGCDFTWGTCSGDNAWGPSADNSLNFGGFLHIGVKSE